MNSEIQRRAVNEIEQRRQNAIFESRARETEIFEKIPAVKQISLQLSNTSAELSAAIFSNQGDVQQKINQIMQKNVRLQYELKDLLTKNGYSDDYLDVKYTCDKCDDSGYIEGMRCECLMKLINQYNIDNFNQENNVMPNVEFGNFSLGYYSSEKKDRGKSDREIMADILQNCQQYAEHFNEKSKSVLMIGGTGLGKTHLSLSIAKEVMKRGFTALYVSAPDLFRKLQNEYYGKGEAGVDTMDILQRANLVIIDDLGAEIENQFASSALYNITNRRLNAEKPTIISTNLSLKEIETRYSDRVASRLMTMYRCLKFIGTDVRQQKLKRHEI